MKKKKREILRRSIAPALTLALLGGLTVQQLSYATPRDADSYHRHVRQVIEGIPRTIGDWDANDVPLVQAATKLLQPNAILSRRYVNRRSHRSVDLLVVHCRSARDMGIHYPPVCYPAHGWELKERSAVTWRLNDARTVNGVEYRFLVRLATTSRTIKVLDLLIVPSGTVTGDIDVVKEAGADYRTHFYGAGQVQLVYAGDTTPAEREEYLQTFSETVRRVVRAIDRGVKR